MSDCIYVIAHPLGIHKVGVTDDPAARLSSLKTEEREPRLCFAFTRTRPDGDARLIERSAHMSLEAHRVRGEWFSVTTEVAVAAVEDAILRADRDYVEDAAQPWTIKSISNATRRDVIKAARQDGMTIGAWLERLVAGRKDDEPDQVGSASLADIAALAHAAVELSRAEPTEAVLLAQRCVTSALQRLVPPKASATPE